MRWIRDGRPETCAACLHDLNVRNVPLFERTIQEWPCPIHGDPRVVTPDSRLWMAFYNDISLYSGKTEYEKDSKRYEYPVLPLREIRELCAEFGLTFLKVWRKLTLIHEGLYGHFERPFDSLLNGYPDPTDRR